MARLPFVSVQLGRTPRGRAWRVWWPIWGSITWSKSALCSQRPLPATTSPSHPGARITMGTMTSPRGGADACREASTPLMRLEADTQEKEMCACSQWEEEIKSGSLSQFYLNSIFISCLKRKISLQTDFTLISFVFNQFITIWHLNYMPDLICRVPVAQKSIFNLISIMPFVFHICHYTLQFIYH